MILSLWIIDLWNFPELLSGIPYRGQIEQSTVTMVAMYAVFGPLFAFAPLQKKDLRSIRRFFTAFLARRRLLTRPVIQSLIESKR